MVKYLRISSYDFATAPLWISLYMRNIWFYFLSVYCSICILYSVQYNYVATARRSCVLKISLANWCAKNSFQFWESPLCILTSLPSIHKCPTAIINRHPTDKQHQQRTPTSNIKNRSLISMGSLRDVVYLGWPISPSYMSPNVGGGGRGGVWFAGFQPVQPMSTAVHMTHK